jgi:uncharacterized protein YbaR (Trm112 family)
MALAGDLIQVVACPQCKSGLEYQANEAVLICHECELAYPVKDDIPVLLIDQAHKLGNRRQSDLTS